MQSTRPSAIAAIEPPRRVRARGSVTTPVAIAAAGQDVQANVAAEWQAGQVPDLTARLREIGRAIDAHTDPRTHRMRER